MAVPGGRRQEHLFDTPAGGSIRGRPPVAWVNLVNVVNVVNVFSPPSHTPTPCTGGRKTFTTLTTFTSDRVPVRHPASEGATFLAPFDEPSPPPPGRDPSGSGIWSHVTPVSRL